MTVAMPKEKVEGVSPGLDPLHEHEFDVECDIRQLRMEGHGLPNCKGDPARWVAWRPGCCSSGPRFRLVCDFCKNVYQKWAARQACITCIHCGAENGGFVSFTPLKGKS